MTDTRPQTPPDPNAALRAENARLDLEIANMRARNTLSALQSLPPDLMRRLAIAKAEDELKRRDRKNKATNSEKPPAARDDRAGK